MLNICHWTEDSHKFDQSLALEHRTAGFAEFRTHEHDICSNFKQVSNEFLILCGRSTESSQVGCDFGIAFVAFSSQPVETLLRLLAAPGVLFLSVCLF